MEGKYHFRRATVFSLGLISLIVSNVAAQQCNNHTGPDDKVAVACSQNTVEGATVLLDTTSFKSGRCTCKFDTTGDRLYINNLASPPGVMCGSKINIRIGGLQSLAGDSRQIACITPQADLDTTEYKNGSVTIQQVYPDMRDASYCIQFQTNGVGKIKMTCISSTEVTSRATEMTSTMSDVMTEKILSETATTAFLSENAHEMTTAGFSQTTEFAGEWMGDQPMGNVTKVDEAAPNSEINATDNTQVSQNEFTDVLINNGLNPNDIVIEPMMTDVSSYQPGPRSTIISESIDSEVSTSSVIAPQSTRTVDTSLDRSAYLVASPSVSLDQTEAVLKEEITSSYQISSEQAISATLDINETPMLSSSIYEYTTKMASEVIYDLTKYTDTETTISNVMPDVISTSTVLSNIPADSTDVISTSTVLSNIPADSTDVISTSTVLSNIPADSTDVISTSTVFLSNIPADSTTRSLSPESFSPTLIDASISTEMFESSSVTPLSPAISTSTTPIELDTLSTSVTPSLPAIESLSNTDAISQLQESSIMTNSPDESALMGFMEKENPASKMFLGGIHVEVTTFRNEIKPSSSMTSYMTSTSLTPESVITTQTLAMSGDMDASLSLNIPDVGTGTSFEGEVTPSLRSPVIDFYETDSVSTESSAAMLGDDLASNTFSDIQPTESIQLQSSIQSQGAEVEQSAMFTSTPVFSTESTFSTQSSAQITEMTSKATQGTTNTDSTIGALFGETTTETGYSSTQVSTKTESTSVKTSEPQTTEPTQTSDIPSSKALSTQTSPTTVTTITETTQETTTSQLVNISGLESVTIEPVDVSTLESRTSEQTTMYTQGNTTTQVPEIRTETITTQDVGSTTMPPTTESKTLPPTAELTTLSSTTESTTFPQSTDSTTVELTTESTTVTQSATRTTVVAGSSDATTESATLIPPDIIIDEAYATTTPPVITESSKSLEPLTESGTTINDLSGIFMGDTVLRGNQSLENPPIPPINIVDIIRSTAKLDKINELKTTTMQPETTTTKQKKVDKKLVAIPPKIVPLGDTVPMTTSTANTEKVTTSTSDVDKVTPKDTVLRNNASSVNDSEQLDDDTVTVIVVGSVIGIVVFIALIVILTTFLKSRRNSAQLGNAEKGGMEMNGGTKGIDNPLMQLEQEEQETSQSVPASTQNVANGKTNGHTEPVTASKSTETKTEDKAEVNMNPDVSKEPNDIQEEK